MLGRDLSGKKEIVRREVGVMYCTSTSMRREVGVMYCTSTSIKKKGVFFSTLDNSALVSSIIYLQGII